ncbi:hypothetical protein WR25_01496 [Diploscapter pachys]|uniref:Uncharacterized protein n=1 Tax=Diploscapter pachys TaxID=2018661 RepID=A0A2A2JRG7_9BILA|nr:hypothetical protein WR25_01496 [Diploscapter pachys]
MKIVSIVNSQCRLGCSLASLEFKYLQYPQLIDPKFDCEEHYNKVYSSTRNPTVMSLQNHYDMSTFNIEYRLVKT